MTKADLVDKVTALGDLTRRDGEIIVDLLFDSVIGALKSGDKIEIRGFGSFRTRQRNSRIGRNPKTGAKVEVPAKKGLAALLDGDADDLFPNPANMLNKAPGFYFLWK